MTQKFRNALTCPCTSGSRGAPPRALGLGLLFVALWGASACSNGEKRASTPVDAGSMPRPGDAAGDSSGNSKGDAGGDGSEADAGEPAQGDAGETRPDASTPDKSDKPIVILMIGDGMGAGQLEAASLYAYGEPGRLFLQSLPHHGAIETGNLSGITDSAAAATTMATGVMTWNRSIGIDREGRPVETILERAQREGYGAGIVTTASLPHATPASFSAHVSERSRYVEIANDQARRVRPFVALGGGSLFYGPRGRGSQRDDEGLIAPLVADGWQYAANIHELAAADPARGQKLLGVFAPEHMDYVLDRGPNSTQPTLSEMSTTALRFLDSYEKGFFLMIEGARIDMASHGNDLPRAIAETLAFDDAIRTVATWAQDRPNVTLIVTADHECGGLRVLAPSPAGKLPEVEWRWGQHTNARIHAFGMGPGTEALHGRVRDHAFVHALALSELLKTPLKEPARVIAPDGSLSDLRHRAAVQRHISGFASGFNQLDTLWLDADKYGLAIGVEGVFEWDKNAVVLLIDRDPGTGTGAGVLGRLRDRTGRADAILSALPLTDPDMPGYGADFAVVSFGGTDPKIDELSPDGGLRGLHPPFGTASNLGWFGAAINFGEGVRTRAVPSAPVIGEGMEIFVPWSTLYPEIAGGGVPPGAEVALSVVLVNDDGSFVSNQALPPFPDAMRDNPGPTEVAVPGVVRFVIDSDGDGVGDGDAEPASTVPAP